MPFVKKTDAKDPQRLTEARKIFIGRREELYFFREQILKPEDPAYNIISISGQGGVGKSTLILRFIDDAHATDFREYCVTALVDERQTSVVTIMEKFADQLHLAGDFEKALRQYKEVLHKLQYQREAAREATARQITTDLAGSLIKDIPFAGTILSEGVEAASTYLFDELHYRQLMKDAERLEDPISDLTKAFVVELNRLAESLVTIGSSRGKRKHRVVLFFDTFEQLALECATWLLDYFLETDISTNVVLVVAGRNPIENSTPNDPKRWLTYLDSNMIYPISLDSFTHEETSNYLAERGITEVDRIETIWQLSHGLPLYLGFLTSNPQGKVDPTANVIANFLRWIPENEHVKRRLALDAALFSRPFNQDELEAFTYITEQDRPILYSWLIVQPFVRSNPQDGRYTYHELAQELFSRHLYQLSPSQCHSARRALVDYYQRLLSNVEAEQGKDISDSELWLELSLSLAYQLFLLPDDASHIKAIEQIFNTSKYSGEAGEVMQMLRKISQEKIGLNVTVDAREIANCFLQIIEFDDLDWQNEKRRELFKPLNYLLEKVTNEPSFLARTLALIHAMRASLYAEFEQYEQALADSTKAIELDPTDADYYDERASIYRDLKQYEQALADYSRAIELDPKNTGFYDERARIHRDLKQYEQALSDYTRVIELKPLAAFYNRRGTVYYELEQYELALADYTKAIELAPKLAVYYANRAGTYRDLKQYELALADCTRAIELAPTRGANYNRRGNVYYDLEQYELALADYTKAIDLVPGNAVYYTNRAGTYRDLKQYELALVDCTKAIELIPNFADLYDKRASVYRDLKQYDLALADSTKAIELEPHAAFYNRRGIVYYDLEQYELALADYTKAIDLVPGNAYYYSSRADTYHDLKQYELALADYNRALELYPTNAYFYDKRASYYLDLKQHKLALADCNQAIELEPRAAFYMRRGGVYHALKQYEHARADYTKAIELAPGNALYYAYRADTFIDLKQYEQAVADYTRAIELEPTEAIFYEIRAATYHKLEQYELALADCNQGIELEPSNAFHYFNRAGSYRGLKQHELALADCTRAIELDPTRASCYNGRGKVYQDLNQYEQALTDYTKAIELSPERDIYFFNRATVYKELKQHKQALADCTRAIELNPNKASYYHLRGNVHSELDLSEQASADYEQAHNLDPNNLDFIYDNGSILNHNEPTETILVDDNSNT